ncbi:Major capsid protein [Carex littledalei]|uniref:Major capsid protein n=1 Tax=Carex littledalei TaxID=544730 RepID=A0A833RG21_9POAL|nr:Major capsid protein [Carex littledalei]
MDTFVRNFFPNYNTPGVDFRFDKKPQTWCFSTGLLQTNVDGLERSVRRCVYQPMTPLGLATAKLERMGSVYDGLNKQYLTAEGQINFIAISDSLKLMAGKSYTEVSVFISKAQSMRWDDNHVSLIFNMMRYVMLKKFAEVTGSLNGSLGHFKEADLDIDLDQYWTTEYPEECAFTTWPTQPPAAGHYVSVMFLDDPFPANDSSALDLRGLTEDQTIFVLIMLNAWTRRSRFKLDFSLPQLTHAAAYRGSYNVTTTYDNWANGTEQVAMPSSASAWEALRKYVTQNRLFEHFSTALYLMSAMTYQFVPETAEGIAWLAVDWKAVLPSFYSIRGRTSFLNTGDAAFLNQRPLDEWGYIANRIEKINLMALVFSQAVYSGFAIRSVRKCFELEPQDLYQSESMFYSVENLISAAAAEFTRVDCPLSGTAGVYISASTEIDRYVEDREVLTCNVEGTQVPQTHTYGVQESTTPRLYTVQVPMMTFPGYPVFLTPTSPFPYDSVYQESGFFDEKTGSLQPRGNELKIHQAWRMINFLNNCGYEARYDVKGDVIGAKAYIQGRYSGQTWPVLYKPEQSDDPVILRQQIAGDRVQTEIPPMNNKFFKSHIVKYKYSVMRRGVAGALHEPGTDVTEVGGHVQLVKATSTVAFKLEDGVKHQRKIRPGVVRLGAVRPAGARSAALGPATVPPAAPGLVATAPAVTGPVATGPAATGPTATRPAVGGSETGRGSIGGAGTGNGATGGAGTGGYGTGGYGTGGYGTGGYGTGGAGMAAPEPAAAGPTATGPAAATHWKAT